jgi:hypothetical protein
MYVILKKIKRNSIVLCDEIFGNNGLHLITKYGEICHNYSKAKVLREEW